MTRNGIGAAPALAACRVQERGGDPSRRAPRLHAFTDEMMALFAQQPTPREILVERVRFLRFAEAEDRFDATMAQLNAFAAKAREG